MTVVDEPTYTAPPAAHRTRTMHLVVCADKHKCCSRRESRRLRDYVEERSAELGLETVECRGGKCFGICKRGPLLHVLPDGVYYHSVTPAVVDRILEEHVIEGNIVEDYALEGKKGKKKKK